MQTTMCLVLINIILLGLNKLFVVVVVVVGGGGGGVVVVLQVRVEQVRLEWGRIE